tara:strand:- start:599 stop:1720 length:1122 start_codon:yes stop_codon:yes gene_type:complete
LSSLKCTSCDVEFPDEEPRWRCECGSTLDIKIENIFPKKLLGSRESSLWRYKESIPLKNIKNKISLGEGMTPLRDFPFAKMEIQCKLDFFFPTGSFKDRGSTVLASKLKEWEIKKVLGDSSGNAAASIAAYTSLADIECDMYVPDNTSEIKCMQISAFGANLKKIKGPRQSTTEAALTETKHCFYASHFWNCWFNHGTKTWAFELWEQMQQTVPDSVIIPVGHGSLVIGAYKGFKELMDAGYSDKLPKIYAVQTKNCAPLVQIWDQKLTKIPEIRLNSSLADGISVSKPVRWKQIIEAVHETDGELFAVEENKIGLILKYFAKQGILMEPTCAIPFLGLKELLDSNKISKKDIIVIPVTGSGLKTPEKLQQFF